MSGAFTKFFGEDPSKSTDRLKIINETHVARLEGLLKEDHGGKVSYGAGAKVNHEERYVPPTIIDSPKLTSGVMKDEIFGPIICILDVKGVDEALTFINERPKPLASYYFGGKENPNKEKLLSLTSSGGVTVNDCCFHVFSPELPFGGVGFSGVGSVHGEHGFNQLSHLKSVIECPTYNGFPVSLKYPPYGPDAVKDFLEQTAPPS